MLKAEARKVREAKTKGETEGGSPHLSTIGTLSTDTRISVEDDLRREAMETSLHTSLRIQETRGHVSHVDGWGHWRSDCPASKGTSDAMKDITDKTSTTTYLGLHKIKLEMKSDTQIAGHIVKGDSQSCTFNYIGLIFMV